jgi:polyhydroxyalkanoate synthesis repressor PhaR
MKEVITMSRIIKRYLNRRLYDAQEKKSITLADLAELIKAGEDITVIDNKTKEDITMPILFQILSMEAREWKESMPSAQVARQLFLKGGGTVADAAKKALVVGIGVLDVTREKVEVLVDDLINKGHLDKKERARTVRELMEKAEIRSREAKDWVEEQVKTTVTKLRPAREAEVEALRQQVADLQKIITRLEEKLGSGERKTS